MDLIRAGQADALSGFREAHLVQVRAYCEVACTPDRVGEACEAAFLDFVGRVGAAYPADQGLEAALLAATRSAAAGRSPTPAVAESEDPRRRRRHPDGPLRAQICAAMPELLALRANGELRGTDDAIAQHLDGCAACAATEGRMQAAETAFSSGSDAGS